MKKIICIVAVVLMIASVVYAQKKMAFTAKDLPALKGMWTGNISFGLFEGGGSSACTLEIFNDTIPLKGKLSVANVPNVVAQGTGLQAGPNSTEADNGKITTQGTIMWTGTQQGFFEITKKSATKIEADYWYQGMKGTATLNKKK